ncbi:Carboxy-cis,cis-muconate cyclase [Diplodia seriata]|uniref:Carboxy-cis,cis-muconate cyclase n=1 Tax=Diplodia seriata TaxID=420778 RepID=A0A1S8BQ44_9PEZI|nr:Carboxy-cis,cis-muconate cyclase [Diplodia seriata]
MKTPTPLLLLPSLVSATVHHLFVGTFSGANLYAVEFDDQTLSLSLAANISAHAAHAWIAFSHDKRALYAVEDGGWTSYRVDNATSLTHTATLPLTGANCSSDRSIYVVGAAHPPYAVYGDPFGDCANVLSVDADTGALADVAQNVSYTTGTSGVHGMALSPDGRFLYSADDSGNAVWTHAVDAATGVLTEVESSAAPVEGANPRHAAVHPDGGYLWVVLEEANELAQYTLDKETGKPVFDNVTYPLIPESELANNTANYWSDDVAVAASGHFLWASARSRDETAPGYISGYQLSPTTGAIVKQLFLTNTTTSGGSANAVTPAPFSDEFVALTDTQEEFVQVWRYVNGTKAEVVARLDLQDGGCCANAVWLD